MARTAHRSHIDAPPADVWAALADLERWPMWASQFTRLERLDAGPMALGSRVRVRLRAMPGAVWEVTEHEAGHLFTWVSSPVPGLRLTGGHVITPVGSGATAEFSMEASGPLGTVLAPILGRGVFARNTRTAAEGLKRYVEGGKGPRSTSREPST
jgi:uncharacterized protein YndB with AHSA1/START domain